MMAATERALLSAEQPSESRRFFYIVTLFVICGPAVGAVVAWVMLLGFTYMNNGRVGNWLGGLGAAFLFAYPIGAPLAAFAGAVHAIFAVWFQRSSFWMPLAAAVITNCALAIVWIFIIQRDWLLFQLLLILPASLVASFVCWRLSICMLRLK